MSALADKTGLTKAQITQVFEAYDGVIQTELRAGRPVTLPGMLKIAVKTRPATKAREMRSFQTGAMIMVAAKPAKRVVRVRALKKLKDMA